MKYQTYKVQDVCINGDEVVEKKKIIFAPEKVIDRKERYILSSFLKPSNKQKLSNKNHT